jgi:hypothetical protein
LYVFINTHCKKSMQESKKFQVKQMTDLKLFK